MHGAVQARYAALETATKVTGVPTVPPAAHLSKTTVPDPSLGLNEGHCVPS